MNKYIALLRGINVSGKNKIKMADLKLVLEKDGLENVITYIQSGNIIFNSDLINKLELSQKIENIIKLKFGLDVPTLVITPLELEQISKNNPFQGQSGTNQDLLYYVFLFETPDPSKISMLEAIDYRPELFEIKNTLVYLYPVNGYGKAKLNNNLLENKLKVKATTRNYKTVEKLLNLCR
jgi:uncharacterized protein (DUF1697 family)